MILLLVLNASAHTLIPAAKRRYNEQLALSLSLLPPTHTNTNIHIREHTHTHWLISFNQCVIPLQGGCARVSVLTLMRDLLARFDVTDLPRMIYG